MAYVQRDEKKKIVAVYSSAQKGVAEEFVEDSDSAMFVYLSEINCPMLFADMPLKDKLAMISCTPLQARLVLLKAGLLDQVNKYISTLPQSDQLAWEYASVISQGNYIVQGAAKFLNLNSEQISSLFQSAQYLESNL